MNFLNFLIGVGLASIHDIIILIMANFFLYTVRAAQLLPISYCKKPNVIPTVLHILAKHHWT